MSDASNKLDSQPGLPMGIGQPATRALHAAGFTSLASLVGASESELIKLHGFGPRAIRVLREAMAEAGLKPVKP